MNEDQSRSNGENVMPNLRSRSTLWQFFYVLTKWKWFIIVYFFAVMIVLTVIILLIPRWYKVEASVLPPRNSDPLSGLSGVAGLSSALQSVSPLLSRTGIGSPSPTFTYLAILNSRTVMDSVIDKFDLVSVYHEGKYPMEGAEKELRANTKFDMDENNALVITVYDKDAVRAADMANYFVKLLNDLFVKVSVEEAHNNRLFVEQRYEQNLSDLKRAEDTLQVFQEHYKVYDMPQQARAAISAASELEAQRMAAEVQLGVMQKQFGPDAPQVRIQMLQVEELQKELNEMQTGSISDHGQNFDFLPAFKNVPELGIAYFRLYRNYEIQTRLLQIMLPLYEQAKMDEQKDTPAVIVLDRAIPPERPTEPKRLFIEIILAFVVFSLLIYFVHLLDRLKSQDGNINPLEKKLQAYSYKAARRFRVKEEIL